MHRWTRRPRGVRRGDRRAAARAREADRPRVLRIGARDRRDPPARQREDDARGEDRRASPLLDARGDGHDRRRQPRSGADLLRADARLRASTQRSPDLLVDPPPRTAARGDGGGLLRVVPSDGPRVHGLSSTLVHRRRGLGVAGERRAARGDADRADQAPRLEAAADLDRRGAARLARSAGYGPARSRNRHAKRVGAGRRGHGRSALARMVSCPTTPTSTTSQAVKRANPAPWITVAGPAPPARRGPGNRVRAVPRLPLGRRRGLVAAARARGRPASASRSSLTARTSGSASTSAANDPRPRSCGSTTTFTSAPAIYHGDGGVLEAVDHVRALAGRFNVRELVYDPWRFGQAAQELEREGMLVVAFPQHDARMIPASARLHAADRRAAAHPAGRPRAGAPRLRRDRPPLPPRLADRQAQPARRTSTR